MFAPVASGDEGVATIFDKMPVSHDAHDTHRHPDQSNREHQDHPIALSLQSIEQVEGDGVHLVWRT